MNRPFIIPFFIPHEGCPHTCLFCDQRTITGRGSRPSREDIGRIIESYLGTRRGSDPVVEAAFFGGSFTAIPLAVQEELLSSVEPFLRSARVHSIRISTRPDYISPSILAFLAERGVRTVELGAQSFDDDVLILASRGHTAGDTVRAVRMIHEAGMQPGIQLMPGLPGDTADKARASASIARDLHPACARIYPAVVLGGTGMAEMFLRGEFTPLAMEDAVERSADMTMILEEGGIPVIRIGIPPLPPGRLPSVLAGPYHPAMGFLVRSRIRRRELEAVIGRFMMDAGGVPPRAMDVHIPFKRKEEYVGMKRENILYLRDLFRLESLNLLPDETCTVPLPRLRPRQ